MKQFELRQDWLSGWSDNYHIKDETGKPVYRVRGNGLRMGTQASFQTMDKKELAYLRQSNPSLTLKKRFDCMKDGKLWARAQQEEWNPLSKKEVTMDIPGDNDYAVTGDRLAHNFEIMLGGKKVATIDKQWAMTDCYRVRILEDDSEADEVDILLLGILLDAMYHNILQNKK